MKAFIYVTCPNCKRRISEHMHFESPFKKYHLLKCYVEQGGCDETFAIRFWAETKAEAYALVKKVGEE